jgi:hypothetical protein
VLTATVGPVLDRNGHQVPDGTVVSVVAVQPGGEELARGDRPGAEAGPFTGVTEAGSAAVGLEFAAGGQYDVLVRAGGAEWQGGSVAIEIAPTPAPAEAAVQPQASVALVEEERARLHVSDLLLALAAVVVVAAAWMGAPGWSGRRTEDQVFILLSAAAGGLSAYIAYGAAASWGRAALGPAAATVLIGAAGAVLVSVVAALRSRMGAHGGGLR